MKRLVAWLSMLGIALALAASGAASAAAQGHAADARLAAARELVLYANYADAIATTDQLLADASIDAATRNDALELRAIAALANRDEAAARTSLDELYARDPAHRLSDPDASPPVVSAFARAREQNRGAVAVDLEHRPIVVRRHESPEVWVSIPTGENAVARVWLSYRLRGEEESTRVEMRRRDDGRYVARIPVSGDTTQALHFQYTLEAEAPSGHVLGRVGNDQEPLTLVVPGEERVAEAANGPVDSGGGSVLDSPWFWTILGVVVIGGGVTIGVLAANEANSVPSGTLGTVTLMVP